MSLTPQRRAEIEARLRAATPGPWEAIGFDNKARHIVWVGDDGDEEVGDIGVIRSEDAALIAHAPADLRALLDALAERAAEIKRLRGLLEERSEGGWLIFYEDHDLAPEVFCGAGAEQAARARYEIARQHWSCSLFKQFRQEAP